MMEYYEADIYPMKTKKKPVAVNIILGLLALLVAGFFIARAAGWTGQKNEAKLLILVNPWNQISAEPNPEFTIIEGTQMVDSRCAADLEDMLRGCRAAGNSPLIVSSYRDWSQQEELYQNKVSELMAQGLDRETAEADAKSHAAAPGYSEHQLGLAVDIVDEGYTALDEKQADTAAQQWLMENCWQYGFILRYPEGKSEITGVEYQPWHYRYVGLSAAEQIHELDITLEEYIDMFYTNT